MDPGRKGFIFRVQKEAGFRSCLLDRWESDGFRTCKGGAFDAFLRWRSRFREVSALKDEGI